MRQLTGRSPRGLHGAIIFRPCLTRRYDDLLGKIVPSTQVVGWMRGPYVVSGAVVRSGF
jgi:hypothetical protein